MPSVLVDRVAAAIEAGARELFRRQRPDGAFEDSPPASVLGTAGAIVALHSTDRGSADRDTADRDDANWDRADRSRADDDGVDLAGADPRAHADLIAAGAAWLRDAQLPDGGWGGVLGADSEPVATAVATAALRIVGGGRDGGQHVAGGLRRLAELGGVAAVGDRAIAHLCRQFLALAGLPGGEGLRRLPLEIVLFDGVRRRRVSFRTSPFVGMALLQTATMPARGPRRRTIRFAVPRALRLLEAIHEHEGRTGAFSDDPWPAALVCLGLARAGLAPHLVEAITGFLRRSVRADGSWDAVANLDLTRSAYAASGLVAAGYATDARLEATRELLRRCRQRAPFPVFGCPAGGWSYSGPDGWPVTLESAEIIAVLASLAHAAGEDDPVPRGGAGWLAGRQDGRGSWSLWVRDTGLPNDGPCPAITGQAVTALLEAGRPRERGPVADAVRWLLGQQRGDGSYHNLWYRDFTSGTAVVLAALASAGHAAHPVAVGARDWLLRAQRPDGSWGDGPSSAAGTVEETAWATHALLVAGGPTPADPRTDGAARRGVRWLLDAQRPDGSWQPSRVCVYIRHHMHYPNGAITHGLALRALGAYRAAASGQATGEMTGKATGEAAP